MKIFLTILSFLQPNKIYHKIEVMHANSNSQIILQYNAHNYFKIAMPKPLWLTEIPRVPLIMADEYIATLEWIQNKIFINEKLLIKKYNDECLKQIKLYLHGVFNQENALNSYLNWLTKQTSFSLVKLHSQHYFDDLALKYQLPELVEWQHIKDPWLQQVIQGCARMMVLST